jgi:fatty-acid peroxygenase
MTLFGPTRTGAREAVSLLRHGYRYWDLRRRQEGSEVVRTRLAHERVVAVRGPEAATFFYEQDGTERSTALPTSLVGPLFGRGAVHTLDGLAHRDRKRMFNLVLGPHAVQDVAAAVARRWDDRAPHWRGDLDVFDEVGRILLESGCEWVGIDLPADEAPSRTRDMLAMVDGFGAPSGRQLRARRARRRTDAWVTDLVLAARRSIVPPRTPLGQVARHVDEHCELLDPHTAAVEVINLVRPLVAVSWLVSGMFEAFAAHPDVRDDLRAGRVSATDVAQEVRRTYPFVPFLATRATRDLHWQGHDVPEGALVVLDVWGTDHDPRTWSDPDTFDPSRFQRVPVTPYNLVPQGGGLRTTGHRCPGEDVVLMVLTTLAPRVAALSASVAGPPTGLRRMPPRPRRTVRVPAGA